LRSTNTFPRDAFCARLDRDHPHTSTPNFACRILWKHPPVSAHIPNR
jgi:hypothetical protein